MRQGGEGAVAARRRQEWHGAIGASGARDMEPPDLEPPADRGAVIESS